MQTPGAMELDSYSQWDNKLDYLVCYIVCFSIWIGELSLCYTFMNFLMILILAGRVLSEKETVTPQIVGNWFANKRKELKKIAREGKWYWAISCCV